MTSSLPRETRVVLTDVVLGTLLTVSAAVLAWTLYGFFRPLRAGAEQWFQADFWLVWPMLTDRYSALHGRTNVHPLFSLIDTPLVYALRRVFGVGAESAVRVWLSAWAAVAMALFYAASRLLRLARVDALLAGLLMLSSASVLFWTSVPETKIGGAATILLCIIAAAIHERKPLSDWTLLACTAIAMSMTITNVMAGLALLLVTRPPRKALQIAINAFFVVSMLQAVQTYLFWSARSMTEFGTEARFVMDGSSGTILNKAWIILAHSVVMPPVQTPIEFDTHTPMLSIQRAPLMPVSAVAGIAVALWLAAFAAGIVKLREYLPDSTALKVLLLTAIGQVALHLVYGDQTFLYSLHFVPLFVLIAAQALRTPKAGWRLLFCGLVLAVIVNNGRQVVYARDVLDRIVPLGKPGSAVLTDSN